MSYKPDEGTLMAYLYGELEGKEKEAVSFYLQQHPEEMKKLQEMADTLKIMGAIQEKEVIAPPVLAEHGTATIVFWKTTVFKTVTSIAAAVLLILVAGKLIGPEIRYSNGEVRISFGVIKTEQPVVNATPVLTAEAVQAMIDHSVATTTTTMNERWTEAQKASNASLRNSLAQNSRRLDEAMKNTSQVSPEQMRAYVSGLQKENLKLFKDYFKLTAKEQNDYVENLLVGFSKYMQEQRVQDLVLVQNKVNDLEKNSDQFQHDTEQLLASIISNAKPAQKSY